ncbi:MAG: helix-turn-helix domain-containing protein [Ruminococcus flavefaciens]|nr:helix-turn-helix domain-containing protein [Ruminococcus flavefaciens]
MRIYEKVSSYIKKNKLSSESIAIRSGIPQKDFQAIISGKKTLYPEELRAICYALNVKPEKFM